MFPAARFPTAPLPPFPLLQNKRLNKGNAFILDRPSARNQKACGSCWATGTGQSISSVFSALNGVHYTFAPQVRGGKGASGASEEGVRESHDVGVRRECERATTLG